MVFHTIEPSTGLSERDRRRAHRLGPPAVAVRTGYPSLLRSARFVDVAAIDETESYRAALMRWHQAYVRLEDDLRDALGDELYFERQRTREAHVGAVDAGLLRRVRYAARRPRSPTHAPS